MNHSLSTALFRCFSIKNLTVSVGLAPFFYQVLTLSKSNFISAGSTIGLYVPMFSIIFPFLDTLGSATTT